MLNSQRDLLFLAGSLTAAVCLLTVGIAIYPDSRQMEVGLSAEPQSIKGTAATAFPQTNLFSIPPEYSRSANVHGAEHTTAENDTDEKEAQPIGGQFGRGFPPFQVNLRTVLADLGRLHSVTQTIPHRPE